ncbi:E3 ubiquitin-protein ligase RHF2A-like [Zingiber officinale]|uniref:RING-type E3 ubiquitin transferase n=1 Tax=Zingiber officinale TaxID=94328 RepID=A0A8J5GHF2_ZINOF|nr:E3 ubiquitin-protein ligase RHF2A-like [Zingiber officinale]KAG6507461.1 hypothetical protein ZIOFF_032806 [Zingiber officinale]
MDVTAKMESHLSSAAAFVEGGILDSCDDACSICLEAFCESDPSTVTSCKHEYHLQCILEWCQRSSQCPMCWQTIILKDPTSQELLEAVVRERNIRLDNARTTTVFHHPALGDFELPIGGNDAELEERIIQHLAAAAAMGRAHHITRREGRVRSGSHSRPQYLVFSTNSNVPSVGSVPASSPLGGDNESSSTSITAANTSAPNSSPGGESDQVINDLPSQATQVPFLTSEAGNSPSRPIISSPRAPTGHSSPVNHERPGPSELQSFPETLKSRFNAVSMRYKESIAKSTRGWRERLFSRNSSVADIGSEVRREVNAGIATVSRMMERLDTRESRRTSSSSPSPSVEVHAIVDPNNEDATTNQADTFVNSGTSSTSDVATSAPN